MMIGWRRWMGRGGRSLVDPADVVNLPRQLRGLQGFASYPKILSYALEIGNGRDP